ncbi:hypothetical protein M3Y96_00954600 [Aphelenchoides besseyi]|nr:hypothetical protein M3Y96_00954600 [Aphelenchoides besseyi]
MADFDLQLEVEFKCWDKEIRKKLIEVCEAGGELGERHRLLDYWIELPMDYGYVQHLRLAQLIALPVSLFALYAEADRLGLSGFLLPAVLVCCALYMNAYRYFYQVDGRFDVDCVLNGSLARFGHAIQAFGPFVLSVLIHFCTPQLPSSSSSLMFNVSHFLVIAAAFCVLVLDVLGAMKKRVQ